MGEKICKLDESKKIKSSAVIRQRKQFPRSNFAQKKHAAKPNSAANPAELDAKSDAMRIQQIKWKLIS
jgi:hypothetical protein